MSRKKQHPLEQAAARWSSRIATWLALGLDAQGLPPDTLRRIRVLAGATALLTFQGLFTAFEFWAMGLSEGMLAIGVAAVLASANLVVLRRTRDPILGSHLALVVLTGMLAFACTLTGGFGNPYFAWFLVIPVAAASTLDVRGVLGWVAITLSITGIFWYLPQFGVDFPNRVPEPLQALQGLVDRVMVLGGLAVLGVSFVAAQRRTETELAHANQEIERESAYLRLLMHAAVAANQATSLEEALRECAKSVCHAMGWEAGHVHLVDDNGRLVSGRIAVSGDAALDPLFELSKQMSFAPGEGLPGRAFATRKPVRVDESEAKSDPIRFRLARSLGLRAGFAVPVLCHGDVVAVIEFASRELLPDDERFEPVLTLVGAQLGRAAERAELEDRLRQVQKLEAIAQLAAGLAHEINNPMAYVRTNLNLLRGEWDSLRKELEAGGDRERASRLAECDDLLAESFEGVDRTIGIVRDVRDFAHGASAAPEPVELEDVVDEAIRVAASQAGPGVRIERQRAGLPPVPGSPGRLRQVFLNLVVNAIHAVGSAGTVRITSERRGRHAVVRVEDDGPGIEPEVRARMFEPFFTTKPVGQGTGLGLYVSYEIVHAHGGEIRVESEPGAGSRFEVRLPL